MKNFISLSWFILSFFAGISLTAQGDGPSDFKFRRVSFLQNKVTIPSAPEAASLGKFGDYKISPFTGTPNISIPLYELKGAEVSVPFSLSYDGGGIRVEQVPTWVGVGWTLNGGGVISRSVKGDPDLKVNYFSKSSTINQASYNEKSNQFDENDFLQAVASKEIETQPDIFYFNAGGQSAKFYFMASKTIVMSEAKDLAITPYWNSSTDDIDSFLVKDAAGINYWFTTTEQTTVSYPSDDNWPRYHTSFVYKSSWYLSKVISPNATETIELKYISEGSAYDPNQYVHPGNNWSRTFSHGWQDEGCPDPTCPCGENYTDNASSVTAFSIAGRKYLDEIIFKKGTITIEKLKFTSSTNSYTGTGGGRKLDKISLYRGVNAGTELIHQQFYYSDQTGRLTLDSIKERNTAASLSKQAHAFYYNTTDLPAFTSSSIDHWGYYNGASNGSWPDYKLLPVINCEGVNPPDVNCPGMDNPTSGADRQPNETHAQAAILIKIVFPTRGYTEFTWEGNRAITTDFICYTTNTERLVGGLRIKNIKTYSASGTLLTNKQYNYVHSNGTCSGILFYHPDYYTSSVFTTHPWSIAQLCSQQAINRFCVSYMYFASSRVPLGSIQGGLVGYSRVEEVFAGKTIYHYKNYAPGTNSWNLLNEFDIQDLGQLKLKEEYDDAGKKLHTTGFKYSFDVSETNRSQTFYGLIVEAKQQQDNKLLLCRNGSSYDWEINGDNNSCDQSAIYQSKWERKHYLITQDWIYQKEVLDTVYYYTGSSLAGSVKKVITHTYGNTNISSPTESVTTNSDSKVYKSVTKFANDVSQSDMIGKNMIGIPLETESYVDNVRVYRTKITYSQYVPSTGLPGTGAWLLPYRFYENFSTGGSDVLRETIDRYHAAGTNVQEANREDDQVNTLIYSHNNMLVAAKVQNALISECAFTGFCTADASQGGWTIGNTGALVPDSDGKTGIGYFVGSTTITKSSIPAGKYILSYWLKNDSGDIPLSGITINSTTISSADPNGWRFVQQTLTAAGTVSISLNPDVPTIHVDELRFYPADAIMTTYSYSRTTLLASGMANENSIPGKFEYDELLRLTGVKNYNSYYLKTNEYNYKTWSSTYNWVKSREVKQDAVTSTGTVNGLTGANVRRQFSYFDDIGRPLQNIGVEQSPASKDVILHHDYDSYGREPNGYLPFTYTNGTPGNYLSTASSELSTFYNNQFGGSEGSYAKTVTEYENSPLNRVNKVTHPGSVFNSKPIVYSYSCNTGSNEVRNFRTASAWYAVNSLNKVKVINENGDSVVTYTDLLGLKVMEARNTVKTYYLYDERQNLVQVIQPVAAASGHSDATKIHTTTSISDGSFVYTYDASNRLSTKKIPSGGTTTYIYDRLDREVVRIDPNSFRIFTKYDILGRVILTGKQTNSSTPSGSEPLYETASGSGYFYTTVAFPTSSFEVYSVNYYDDYDWEDNGSNDATYRGGYGDYLSANYPWVRGKLTRAKNGRLNQNGTAPSTWMDDILFYDIEGKEIQKQSLQQLGYVDTTWRQYDFPGRLRKTQWSHMNNTTRTLITERFEYDHADRLVETFHKIGTQTEQKISNQAYNERDELSQKQLAYSGGNYGQSIDYTYNIRKWLTQINDPASCGADLFSQKLYYSDANASLSATAKYNGNIAWMEWTTGANCTIGGVSRNKAGYGFTYDGLDRMTNSKYGEYSGSWTNLNRYNENLTYDLNGNILTLGRRGYISAGTWNAIDTLTYTYGNSSNPNWATTIADGSGSALGYPNTSGTFSFDAAGNQTTYSAKGITEITYNHLNLPTKYTWSGSTLEIQYDASGRKLKKIPSTGNAKTYVGVIEYSATAIEAIYHPEGRARLISSTWEYEYGIKDHLGNPRVYFKYNGSISFLQENHYYPFGAEQGGWSAPPSPENKYKYNGKEYNDDFALGLYDYGARWYDPVAGRWGQVDPKADKLLSWNPYNFSLNNPIFYVDPDGRMPSPALLAMNKLKAAANKILSYTDFNDASVLVTSVTRGGKAVNIDGSSASTSDKWAAALGAMLPVVSGSFVKKIGGRGANILDNALNGARREAKATEELRKGAGEILEQRYILDENGKLLKGADGKSRRLDQVRVEEGRVTQTFETTSPAEAESTRKLSQVDRGDQLIKSGNAFVKDEKGNIIPINKNAVTQIIKVQ